MPYFHRRPTTLIVFLVCIALSLPIIATAQTALPVITLENSGQIASALAIPIDSPTHLEWSPAPANERLAVSTIFGTYVYDIDAALAGTIAPVLIGGADAPAQDLAFSADGTLLAVASGSIIRVFDVNTNEQVFTLQGGSPIAFNPAAPQLLYTNGNEARLFDLTTFGEIAALTTHRDRINDLVFSSDGSLIATASQDNTLRYWRGDGEAIGFSRSRRNPILSVDISPNNALILSGTRRGAIRLLNMAVTTESVYMPPGTRDEITSIDVSSTGTMMLYTVQNTIHLREIYLDIEPVIFADHGAAVVQAQFNHDGTRFASIGLDNLLRVYAVGE